MTTAPAAEIVPGAEPVAPAAPVPDRHAPADQRLASLDFVKGVLVLVMVLYHWLNYFIGLQWQGYRYLRFLTPAFIFISGYMVSRVYLARYAADDPRLRRRLIWRGLKLLALFLALNILIDWTIGGARLFTSSDPSIALSWAKAVFAGERVAAAFEILVSIAYFLVLAPFVLLVSKRLAVPLWAISSIAIIAAAIGSAANRINLHFEIVPLAFLGLAAGAHSSTRFAAVLGSPALLLPAYVMYLAAVMAWNVSYPLLVVGVALNLLVMSAIASMWGTSGTIQGYIVRMGQYSLFAYIAQIAVLQLLRRVVNVQLLTVAGLWGCFAAALFLTVIAVELTILFRSRSPVFDRAYRAVFA